jgi:hypothetical protein
MKHMYPFAFWRRTLSVARPLLDVCSYTPAARTSRPPHSASKLQMVLTPFVLTFILFFLSMGLYADDNNNNNDEKMIQRDFSKPYNTGLNNDLIINYKQKTCDFQWFQASRNPFSSGTRTSNQTGGTTAR